MIRSILLLLLLIILTSPSANAGVLEVSYAFSRTDSKIDEDNFSRSLSHTGSISWYFFEMSALELSYTKGEGQVSGKPADGDLVRYRTQLELYGADLVFTFAQKDWVFQPYVKGGAVWVDKKIYRTKSAVDLSEVLINETDKSDPVPSMGAGIRILLTKSISIKASYDRWRSGKSGDTETWDSTTRAGVSFYF